MYHILICDDQPDIVNALKRYLSPEGYHLYEAFNGEEALEMVRQHDFHLILLDIMMPRMDGITTTSKIREFSNVPIILLTAKNGQYRPQQIRQNQILEGQIAQSQKPLPVGHKNSDLLHV